MPAPSGETRNSIGQGATTQALTGVLRSAFRAFHGLWLEITGFIFLVFALAFLVAGVREYREAAAANKPLWEVAAAVGLAVMFGYFGVTAFWRARRQ